MSIDLKFVKLTADVLENKCKKKRVSDHPQATSFYIAKQILNNLHIMKYSNYQNILFFEFPNKIATTH